MHASLFSIRTLSAVGYKLKRILAGIKTLIHPFPSGIIPKGSFPYLRISLTADPVAHVNTSLIVTFNFLQCAFNTGIQITQLELVLIFPFIFLLALVRMLSSALINKPSMTILGIQKMTTSLMKICFMQEIEGSLRKWSKEYLLPSSQAVHCIDIDETPSAYE